jgi:hypothetical protein
MERESCSQIYDVEQDSRFSRHVGFSGKVIQPEAILL